MIMQYLNIFLQEIIGVAIWVVIWVVIVISLILLGGKLNDWIDKTERNLMVSKSNRSIGKISAIIVLGVWIFIFSIGLINVIMAFIPPYTPLISVISFNNILLIYGGILSIYPSKHILVALRSLIKSKRWENPFKLIFYLIILFGLVIFATLLTIFGIPINNFDANLGNSSIILGPIFLVFSFYTFVFSIFIIAAWLYYYRSPAFRRSGSPYYMSEFRYPSNFSRDD